MASSAIRYYREKVGLTQAELAKKLDVDPGTMSKLEAGILIPTTEQVDRIATLLETTPALLWSKHILAEVAARARALAS